MIALVQFLLGITYVTGLGYNDHFKIPTPQPVIKDQGGRFGLGYLGQRDGLNPNDQLNLSGLSVTVTSTVDVFVTLTNVVYNSIPVTLTDFDKTTLTLPTRVIFKTPVDDVVSITKIDVTRYNETVTVTDTATLCSIVTVVSTENQVVTHLESDIKHTVVTSTVFDTHTFRHTMVRTKVATEYVVETETVINTSTVWVDALRDQKNYY